MFLPELGATVFLPMPPALKVNTGRWVDVKTRRYPLTGIFRSGNRGAWRNYNGTIVGSRHSDANLKRSSRIGWHAYSQSQRKVIHCSHNSLVIEKASQYAQGWEVVGFFGGVTSAVVLMEKIDVENVLIIRA